MSYTCIIELVMATEFLCTHFHFELKMFTYTHVSWKSDQQEQLKDIKFQCCFKLQIKYMHILTYKCIYENKILNLILDYIKVNILFLQACYVIRESQCISYCTENMCTAISYFIYNYYNLENPTLIISWLGIPKKQMMSLCKHKFENDVITKHINRKGSIYGITRLVGLLNHFCFQQEKPTGPISPFVALVL